MQFGQSWRTTGSSRRPTGSRERAGSCPNHSGGLLPSEGFFTEVAIYDHFKCDRAVYALAHDFLFEDPTLRRYAGRLGLLRAGRESARHAFAAGAGVLVYPGSDLDTFRPFRDRNKIVLGERKGFPLPWGITCGFVPYLPLPAQTTLAFLPPMTWPDLGPDSADRAEDLERCYRDVERAMQAAMDRMTRGRRFLRGQPDRHTSSIGRSRHATDIVDAHRI